MSCGKRPYDTDELAVEALLGARIRFQGNTAIAVYQCEECGYWHLTSHGKMDSRLANALQNGSLERQREAEYWEKKLR